MSFRVRLIDIGETVPLSPNMTKYDLCDPAKRLPPQAILCYVEKVLTMHFIHPNFRILREKLSETLLYSFDFDGNQETANINNIIINRIVCRFRSMAKYWIRWTPFPRRHSMCTSRTFACKFLLCIQCCIGQLFSVINSNILFLNRNLLEVDLSSDGGIADEIQVRFVLICAGLKMKFLTKPMQFLSIESKSRKVNHWMRRKCKSRTVGRKSRAIRRQTSAIGRDSSAKTKRSGAITKQFSTINSRKECSISNGDPGNECSTSIGHSRKEYSIRSGDSWEECWFTSGNSRKECSISSGDTRKECSASHGDPGKKCSTSHADANSINQSIPRGHWWSSSQFWRRKSSVAKNSATNQINGYTTTSSAVTIASFATIAAGSTTSTFIPIIGSHSYSNSSCSAKQTRKCNKDGWCHQQQQRKRKPDHTGCEGAEAGAWNTRNVATKW